jgi:hypothetical protein
MWNNLNYSNNVLILILITLFLLINMLLIILTLILITLILLINMLLIILTLILIGMILRYH